MIFVLVETIFEMLHTQHVWRYLPKREQNNAWWNIGFKALNLG